MNQPEQAFNLIAVPPQYGRRVTDNRLSDPAAGQVIFISSIALSWLAERGMVLRKTRRFGAGINQPKFQSHVFLFLQVPPPGDSP
jgi:hypothetical protein